MVGSKKARIIERRRRQKPAKRVMQNKEFFEKDLSAEEAAKQMEKESLEKTMEALQEELRQVNILRGRIQQKLYVIAMDQEKNDPKRDPSFGEPKEPSGQQLTDGYYQKVIKNLCLEIKSLKCLNEELEGENERLRQQIKDNQAAKPRITDLFSKKDKVHVQGCITREDGSTYHVSILAKKLTKENTPDEDPDEGFI